MTTTTDRHSKSYHKRMLGTASYSSRMADQVCDALTEAGNRDGSLYDNSYFVDTIREARERADEMAADIDCRITAAIEDGFTPEDFE